MTLNTDTFTTLLLSYHLDMIRYLDSFPPSTHLLHTFEGTKTDDFHRFEITGLYQYAGIIASVSTFCIYFNILAQNVTSVSSFNSTLTQSATSALLEKLHFGFQITQRYLFSHDPKLLFPLSQYLTLFLLWQGARDDDGLSCYDVVSSS